MNRRRFLAMLGFGTVAAAAAANSVFDVERLLWVPGEKTILLPAVDLYHVGGNTFLTAEVITREALRVFKNNLTVAGQSRGNRTAVRWPDTIGIGQYFYADIHKESATACDYPSYIESGAPVLPYYLPFRSLTVAGAPNLLVVGKSIASTFFANAAIRLHPEEWVTGVAAGVAAGLMVEERWASTQQALDNVAAVQAAVAAMGSPLEWTLP